MVTPRSIARLRQASSCLRGLLKRPAEGYRPEDVNGLQDVVDNPRYERIARRLLQNPQGRELFEEGASIYAGLSLEELAGLPAQTLGGAFGRFMLEQGLDPIVSRPGEFRGSDAAEYTKARHREIHDILHVLLDIGISPREEVVVQAFSLGQGSRLVSWAIVLVGLFKYGRAGGEPAIWRELVDAYRRGRRAAFMLATRWESMWDTELSDARAQLGLSPV